MMRRGVVWVELYRAAKMLFRSLIILGLELQVAQHSVCLGARWVQFERPVGRASGQWRIIPMFRRGGVLRENGIGVYQPCVGSGITAAIVNRCLEVLVGYLQTS